MCWRRRRQLDQFTVSSRSGTVVGTNRTIRRRTSATVTGITSRVSFLLQPAARERRTASEACASPIVRGLLVIARWTGIPLACFYPRWMQINLSAEMEIAIDSSVSIGPASALWALDRRARRD
jgi:hypothetical protein